MAAAHACRAFQIQSGQPDPDDPNYKNQVAASIQDLISGRRPRNPKMSGASTGRLIVEGVVENLKIFRIYKQDKAREAKEKEEERKERMRRGERKHHSTSHRSEGERNAHRHRHRRHSNDGYGDSGSRDRENHGQDTKHHSHALETTVSHAQDLIPSALHTAKSRVGPDGTPFGSLPTRGKHVGFLAHVKNTYSHIKAEQAAGHRCKGFAEKYLDAVLRKRIEAKPAGGKDKSQLIRNNGHFQPETGYWQHEKRQKHRYGSDRSRHDKKEEDATDRALETHTGRLRRRNSRGGPVHDARTGRLIQVGEGNGRHPSASTQSPAPSASSSSDSNARLSARNLSSVNNSRTVSEGSSLGATRTPSIRVQPPSPSPSPSPPPPLSRSLPIADSSHGALPEGIVGGAKLREVAEEDKNDRTVLSKGKVITGLSSEDRPLYEETAHSHAVEVREHAQAVEEEECRQEKASRAAREGPRTATPFIAPHPKTKLPSNFQDELAAKLREASLSRPEQNGEAEIGPCKGRGVLKPQPSSESWRSNITFHEEESRIPNKTFREKLGNILCAGNNPQPQAALATVAPAGAESPAAAEFHSSLSARVASEPDWDWPNNLPGSDGGDGGTR